jgi:hypothetical protein
LFAEKLVEYFSAYLRALAKRDGGLRADGACFTVPFADLLNVCHDISSRQQGFGRIDLRLRH